MFTWEVRKRLELVDEEGNIEEYLIIAELAVNDCEKYVVMTTEEKWEKEETEVMVMLQKDADEGFEFFEVEDELADAILHLLQVMNSEEE